MRLLTFNSTHSQSAPRTHPSLLHTAILCYTSNPLVSRDIGIGDLPDRSSSSDTNRNNGIHSKVGARHEITTAKPALSASSFCFPLNRRPVAELPIPVRPVVVEDNNPTRLPSDALSKLADSRLFSPRRLNLRPTAPNLNTLTTPSPQPRTTALSVRTVIIFLSLQVLLFLVSFPMGPGGEIYSFRIIAGINNATVARIPISTILIAAAFILQARSTWMASGPGALSRILSFHFK